ncbi:MAG: putative bifunctional diguanylate cyclase/phosphodiesterase [Acidobacteriota bacterium]
MVPRRKAPDSKARDEGGFARLVVERFPLSAVVLDEEGLILYASPGSERLFGHTADELLGRRFTDFLPPEDILEWIRVTAEGVAGRCIRHRIVAADRKWIEIESTPAEAGPGQAPAHVLVFSREARPSVAAPGEGPQWLLSAIEQLEESVLITDLEGTIEYVNAAFERVTGYTRQEVIGKTPRILKSGHHDEAIYDKLWKTLQAGESYRGVMINRRKDGTIYHEEKTISPVRDRSGAIHHFLATGVDVTQRRMAEEQLQHDALHDPLTGLPNRTLFLDRLGLAMARAQRYAEYRFGILFVDLDRFKLINDSMGHLSGDELLMEVSSRLVRCLRSSDTVARLGGDEFAVLLDNIPNVETAVHFAERIHEQIAEPCRLSGHEVYSSGSIGVAFWAPHYERPDEMIRDADTAMYEAKRQGRGCHAVFDHAMRTKVLRLLEVETDLRQAVADKRLAMFYQPIVDLGSGDLVGFEALLRWRHPEHGVVTPGHFLEVAEENGLILPIGQFTIREAARHLRLLQDQRRGEPPLVMCINLSTSQFAQRDLAEQLRQAASEFRLDPSWLRLEITESTLLHHSHVADATLSQLKAHNLRLCVDDFGTGYASLSNLRRYPIDAVKIDHSFVGTMCEDEGNRDFVRTTITLAKTLKMQAVAVGIERPDQIDMLRSMGCPYGQGYYFARPMEEEDSVAFLQSLPGPN